MGERRVGNWLTATLLGAAGGSVVAFVVMLAFGAATGSAVGDEPGVMLLLVGYVAWAAVALAISAWWLRRRWREP